MAAPQTTLHLPSSSVYDAVTGLPHQFSLLAPLEQSLKRDGALGALVIALEGMDRLEEAHGGPAVDEVVGAVAQALQMMRGQIIRQDDFISIDQIGGSTFMIFLSARRAEKEGTLQRHDVESFADRLYENLFPVYATLLAERTRATPRLTVGHAFVVHNPLIRTQRLLYRLIETAKGMAHLQYSRFEARAKERLQRVILSEDIRTLFQPIVDFNTRKVIGYEALTRGPQGTVYESPITLFAMAKKAGLVFELDRLCRKKALARAKELPPDCKIFVNTLPHTIHDPEFRGQRLEAFLEEIQKVPSNIVFEITERAAIENFSTFREAMRYYTDLGMSIAVDDIGTGYSTLESIIELNPAYLKFDLRTATGLRESRIKQEMLRMLCGLATRMGAQVIAEGIETQDELDILTDLGLRFGQGFFFARPGPAAEVSQPLRR